MSCYWNRPRLKSGQSTQAPATQGQQPSTPSTPSTPAGKGAYLGVSTTDAPGGAGAIVQDVVTGSPAARAGIQGVAATGPGGGDTITRVDAHRVHSAAEVVAAIGKLQPGDLVSIEVQRSGGRFAIDVTLGTKPATGP